MEELFQPRRLFENSNFRSDRGKLEKITGGICLNIPRIIFLSLTKIWGKRAFSDSLLVCHCFYIRGKAAEKAGESEYLPEDRVGNYSWTKDSCIQSEWIKRASPDQFLYIGPGIFLSP
jgi:hypothetical protein